MIGELAVAEDGSGWVPTTCMWYIAEDGAKIACVYGDGFFTSVQMGQSQARTFHAKGKPPHPAVGAFQPDGIIAGPLTRTLVADVDVTGAGADWLRDRATSVADDDSGKFHVKIIVPDSLLPLWPGQSAAPPWGDIKSEGFCYDRGCNANRSYVPTGSPPIVADKVLMDWLLGHEGVEPLSSAGSARRTQKFGGDVEEGIRKLATEDPDADMHEDYADIAWGLRADGTEEQNGDAMSKARRLLALAKGGRPGAITAWREHLLNGTDDANALHTMRRALGQADEIVAEWPAEMIEQATARLAEGSDLASSAGTSPAILPAAVYPPHLGDCATEQSLSMKINATTRGYARYAIDTGGWLRNAGEKWEQFDYSAAVFDVASHMRLATEDTIESAMNNAQANREQNVEAAAKRHNANVLKISGAAGRAQVVKTCTVAAFHAGEGVRVSSLDGDGSVIWAGGKCWDIRTGAELPTRAQDVHLLSAAYAPAEGDHPKFSAMCAALFPDRDLMVWATLVMARCFHGMPDKHLLELLGVPFSGKSPWAMYFARLLGDYAAIVDEDVLTNEDPARAFGPVAGCRYCYLDEWTDHKGKRPANRIKALTNGQSYRARRLYQDSAVYPARHTFTVSLNPEATLPYGDAGVRARLIRVPFLNTDREAVRLAVEGAYEAIDAEGPAVMAMMLNLAGYLLGHPGDGTMADAPQAARIDLAASVADADTVARWQQECTEPGGPTQGSALYVAYRDWCQRLGEQSVTQTMFGRRLTEEGYPAEFGGPRCNVKVRALRLLPTVQF